jgi:His/Glu/Gln/Arg/opine family amino acid ABC transporter permease subunit
MRGGPVMPDLQAGFIPAFLAGLVVNFGIALWALVGGLLFGLPLAWLRMRQGRAGRLAGLMVSPMRTAPTFVVMFFVLNALPARMSLGGWEFTVTPWLSVVLSLAVYMCSYVADNAVDAMGHLRAGNRAAALLFLPGLARAFFVAVLSSGAGAAVGVAEAISVTLREVERMPSLKDKVLLMLGVMLFFVLSFQAVYAALDWVRRRLNAAPKRPPRKNGR